MATFCLVKPIADKFKAAIKDGTVDPEKMSNMSSGERHAMLEKIVGKDNATQVNALFESKLLLKNQQAGMVAWAKRMLDMTPVRRQDLISKIERLDHVLSESEAKSFLGDLAETRLGVDVTQEEANKIADLTKKMTDAQKSIENGGDRMAYGRARVELTNYVSDLKNEASRTKLKDFMERPFNAAKNVVSGVGGFTKSLKASLDNSALFRQGWKAMLTDPEVWGKNAMQSFKDIADSFGGKEVLNEVHADILSRPTYQKMKDAHLAVSVKEEAFPTSLPEKIPLFGRVFKASEAAYTAFLDRTRADIFDKYLQIAEKTGVNTQDPEQLRAIGRVVNSLTGRGHLGGFEQSANMVNNIFFSARDFKSQIDVLTAHSFDKNMTPFARKKAAENLVRVIGGTAVVLGVANAVRPGSVEWDPRSSDFGKIKIGNTRFNIAGGMGSVITLAARLVTGKSKSTSSGSTYDINRWTAIFGDKDNRGFVENKLSPTAGLVDDLLRQQTFDKEKPTIKGELKNLLLPLPVQNAMDLYKDPNSANKLLAIIADGLGIAVSDYKPKEASISSLMKAAAQAKMTEADKKKNAAAAAKRKATLDKKKADFAKSIGR